MRFQRVSKWKQKTKDKRRQKKYVVIVSVGIVMFFAMASSFVLLEKQQHLNRPPTAEGQWASFLKGMSPSNRQRNQINIWGGERTQGHGSSNRDNFGDEFSHHKKITSVLHPKLYSVWRQNLMEQAHIFRPFSSVDTNSVNTSVGWCYPASARQNLKTNLVNGRLVKRKPSGLLLAKTFKTASSTAAALTMRLARRVAQRLGHKMCRNAYLHEQSLANEFASSRNEGSFLWSTIRHPIDRAVSAYWFYAVTSLGLTPSPSTLIAYLEATKDQMTQQLRTDRDPIQEVFGILLTCKKYLQGIGRLLDSELLGKIGERDAGTDSVPRLIRGVVQQYSFLAVSERLDECIVLLMILLGLIPNTSVDDIVDDSILADGVVLPSKVSSSSNQNITREPHDWVENWLKQVKQSTSLARIQVFERTVLAHPSLLLQNITISDQVCVPVKTKGNVNSLSSLLKDSTVQAYLKSNYTRDNVDFLLYDYVNESLDRTIETIVVGGRERMNQLLIQFRTLHARATASCWDSAIFPCSRTGMRQLQSSKDCYLRDMGCGYPCVDQLFPVLPNNGLA